MLRASGGVLPAPQEAAPGRGVGSAERLSLGSLTTASILASYEGAVDRAKRVGCSSGNAYFVGPQSSRINRAVVLIGHTDPPPEIGPRSCADH